MHLRIISLAKIDPNFLDTLADSIETVFNDISDEFYFSCGTEYKQETLPKLSYDISKKQHNAELILENLHFRRENSNMVLGILDVDIFADPHVFLYGKADVQKKVALISLFRLLSKLDSDPYKLMQRAVKEAVHEIGHLFGLDHCTNRQCVMVSSENISEIDRKSTLFCKRCIQKLIGHDSYLY